MPNSDNYTPPEGDSVALDFSVPYTPPDGDSVALEFVPSDGPKGEEQYVFPESHESSLVSGQVWVKLHTRYLVPASVEGTHAFGSQTVHNYLTFTKPSGIASARYGNPGIRNRNRYFAAGGFRTDGYGNPSLINWNKDVYPQGFSLWRYQYQRFGRPHIWNLLQIPRFQGFDTSSYGSAFLRGGVKYLYLSGKRQDGYGRPVVINTMADQHAKPKGIKPPSVGWLSVSPRMLYPDGIFEYGFSEPLVQFPPWPKGWESSRTGTPDIDYWTKVLPLDGIDPGEHVGYPRVRDRAQTVFARSVLGAGIFGDTYIFTTAGFISVPGGDYFEPSSYSEVRSNRRSMDADGFNAQLFGDTGVRNKTPSFSPLGIEPVPVSPHSVGYWQRYVRGRGFQNEHHGRATLTQTPSIAPRGIESESFGLPTTWPAVRGYELDGIDALKVGAVTVWFRVRRIPMESGFRGDRYGQPRLEHSRRFLQGQGALKDSYGQPRVSNSDRTVTPEGIFDDSVSGHLVGGTRFLKAFGFVATRFGERIIPPRQTFYPRGFTNEFGLSLVYNQTIYIPLEGITTTDQPQDSWGTARVFSSRQYIEMHYDPDSQLNVPDWPIWTLIENRNKVLGAIGSRHELFGNPAVFNNARVIEFDGVQPPSLPDYYESGMVAFRVRPLRLDGLEPPYMARWTRVYSDAFVVAPNGFRADVYGQAEVETTRRYFKWIGGFLSEQHGIPMIADRVRGIEFEKRYAIGPPRIQLHTVDLYTRYIEGIGSDMAPVGLPSLSIHFNKVRTRWTHQELFGWARARNLTPELLTRGRASDVFGSGLVRLEWRPVDPDGSDMQRFGRTTIADTDRSVWVRGFNAGEVGHRTTLILGKQPPFTDQTITLTRHGIPFPGAPWGQVPDPIFNQSVLYAFGFEADRFGDAFLQSNALIVDYGIKLSDPYGMPFVGLKNRKMAAKSAGDFVAYGKPRISPHTIWATTQTPSQASRNHPYSERFRPVGETRRYPAGERFGNPRASTYRGLVRQYSSRSFMALGRPKLQLKLRFIQVPGTRLFRMGWHKLGDGTQELKLFGAKDFMEFGKPKLVRPPYTGPQHVKPKGLSGAFGSHRVEHFHREMFARGRDSLRMGTRKSGDSPYMWQGLRVGPLMPTIPEGFEQAEYGEPWVSYRVREFVIDGFNTFRSEYDLENFAARMRVRNSFIPRPPDQDLQPVGVDVPDVGAPNVALAARYILPDGNADQYRKGAPN